MLDKRFDFKKVEQNLLLLWKRSNTYKFKKNKKSEPFCIMMPPPNITGSLHMGHALTFTLQDILIRYNKKIGKNVLWQPGTDHAGIATEIIVEQQLKNEEKLSKKQIGRNEFIKKIWKWKNKSGNKIVEQMNRLGTSVDWSLSKFTMDEDLSETVSEAFIQLYEEGLIYKDKRLVNWDPQLQTAISDLEVSQNEIEGKMWYLKYQVENLNEDLVVATTRPETIFGDTAIAIHPKNNKLKKFIGKSVKIPLTKKSIKVISDEYADPTKGSGAVKITPAHDFNDFDVGIRNNLEFVNIFDKNCRLVNENFIPKKFQGLDRFDAREKVIDELKKKNSITNVEKNKMMLPTGERSGVVVEPFLTNQWFVDSKKLCDPILTMIKKNEVRFHPSLWINTFKHWINNIQPWCISRQIWWGHRIPIWYSNKGDMIAAKKKADAEKKLKKINKLAVISHQETDVLDTWFSSALWPFSTLGGPKSNELIRKFYPTNVLVTGFDIIFFWVARMMMMGIKFMKTSPFQDIYIHPLVKDEKGKKMSKSKGNIIDPLSIIDLYGADSLRFTLANLSTQGRDIKLSNKLVENSRNFITKLWNVARFSQFNKFKFNKKFNPKSNKFILNKWIFYRYMNTKNEVIRHLREFKFNLLINELYQFIWNDFCDLFIEFSKYSIKTKNKNVISEISNNFSYIFSEILNMINPVIPFVTEKISYELDYTKKSLFEKPLEEVVENFYDKDIKNFQNVIELIKKIRFEISNRFSQKFSLEINSIQKINWLDDNKELIVSIFKFEKFKYNPEDSIKKNSFVVGGVKFTLISDVENSNNQDKILEQINFFKKEILYFEKKLENKNFITKAPKKVVDAEKKKLKAALHNLKLLEKNNV